MGETVSDNFAGNAGASLSAGQMTIQREIAIRAKIHQRRIATLRTEPAANRPLVFLAYGDSWFDYPLIDNGPFLSDTDVIHHLRQMGSVNPLIVNMSHHGDSTVDEMSLPKQQRVIATLQDSTNWLDTGKPDAILFSGGGNDIAGEQFLIYLQTKTRATGNGLAVDRFERMLDGVEASYLDLFAFRDEHAPGVPIFGHCYDFGIPDGRHPICAGPWISPSLKFAGYNVAEGRMIVRDCLERFKARLNALATVPANNYTLVDTQGTLTDDEWANELHPKDDGFGKIADRFLTALRLKFGADRI